MNVAAETTQASVVVVAYQLWNFQACFPGGVNNPQLQIFVEMTWSAADYRKRPQVEGRSVIKFYVTRPRRALWPSATAGIVDLPHSFFSLIPVLNVVSLPFLINVLYMVDSSYSDIFLEPSISLRLSGSAFSMLRIIEFYLLYIVHPSHQIHPPPPPLHIEILQLLSAFPIFLRSLSRFSAGFSSGCHF